MERMKGNIQQINKLQKELNYSFKNQSILKEALTHSSHANEFKYKISRNNERLEFLGDSVLSLVISDYIFKKYENMPEGELTKVRSNIVCEATLALKAKEINLGQYLLLGKGELLTGGRNRISILADAFEAITGALYIDGGLETATYFILNTFADSIELAVQGILFRDYKTYLQELLQSKCTDKITYKVVDEQGPDHDKVFEVEVLLSDRVLGRGKGRSKKIAEQKAAQEAIERTKTENV